MGMGASLLMRSGALRMVDWLVNRVEPRRDATGAPSFPFVRRRRARSLQILAYHQVNDEHDAFFPATPVAVFARQMEHLASRFTVLPLDVAVEAVRRDDLPDNAVAVTFDDGYKDNYLNAYPILSALKIPATIFLATDAIGSGRVLWHDRVFGAFRDTAVQRINGFGGSYSLGSRMEKLDALTKVLVFLHSVSEEERLRGIERLVERLEVADRRVSSDLMLSWAEVEAMRRDGIAFGAHTVSHPVLSTVDAERARREIFGAKAAIEDKLGTTVTAFAYPGGKREHFDRRARNLVEEAGYRYALTTLFGVNEAGQDVFELRRGGPWEEEISVFAAKLRWYRFTLGGPVLAGRRA